MHKRHGFTATHEFPMCFSPEVSFASAAVLVPAGAYALRLAARKAPQLWPMAVVPVVFGVQQACEGFVWLGLRSGDERLTAVGSRAFLFFAYAFWPFWFSAGAAIMEPVAARRRWLFACTLASTAWFWLVYLPVLTTPGAAARIDHHSIHYDYPDGGPGGVSWPWGLRLGYVAAAVVPIALSSLWRVFFLPMALALVSAAVTMLVFEYAFSSVWCLFAALLSVVVLFEIGRFTPEASA